MTALVLFALLGHIKLTDPPSFQVTLSDGSPNKAAPCGGAGTPTGIVTTVEAGSQLTVSWTEPIKHPGHFRIGIASDPSAFVTPPVTADSSSACGSTTIETNPSLPTIVDGLFPHTVAQSTGAWTTTITVPMMSCENCMLQLMQFMGQHGAPCFYYQCAALRIVMPDAGVPDAGSEPDAGAPVVDAGSPEEDAGASVDAGPGELMDAGHSETGDAGLLPVTDAGTGQPMEPAGCGCSSLFGLGPVLLGLWVLRRRK